jgi:hypothetical protein
MGINVKRLKRQEKMRSFRKKPDIFSFILIFVSFQFAEYQCLSQDSARSDIDTINISGQLSLWASYSHRNTFPVRAGLRYIPSIYYGVRASGQKLIDFEASANIYGTLAFHPFDTANTDGSLKPYRFWMRYSSEQFELRLGLQKINFGSASMLRPLMWFDQMDPRDPLHLTDGVWGLLARYYFLNNTNVWLWGLYGNNNPRGWELVPVNRNPVSGAAW